MAKKSEKKNNSKEPKNPTKPIEEIQIGDVVIVNGLKFTVKQIDELPTKRCLVDEYACDYYVRHGEKVEIINKEII